VEERRARIDVELVPLAVDLELDHAGTVRNPEEYASAKRLGLA
jgi:hypothetical protein